LPTLSTAPAGSHVGTYAIAASGAVDNDYTITYVAGSLTIGKAALTITANPQTKTYGSTVTFTDTEFSPQGLVNGDSVANVTLTSDGAAAGAVVNTYAIVPGAVTGTGLDNYTISLVPGVLTVNKAPLTIIVGDVTKTYGQTPTLTATINGLMNGDNITPNCTSDGAAANAPVGTYTIVDPPNDLDHKLGNYAVTEKSGTLTVKPAPLSVIANNAFKTYGQANPTLGGTLIGIVAGDNITDSYSTIAGQSSNVGTYTVTASLTDPNGRLANYTVTNTSGILTVSAAPLTITAIANTKTYGQPDPALTYTVTGLQLGDTASILSGSLTRIAGENVGSYAITEGTVAANDNYTIIYVGSTLSITKATSATTVTGAGFTYDGTVHTGGSAVVSGAGTITGNAVLSYSGDQVDAGFYTVTATYVGDANHFGSVGSATITINKANAAITVTPYSVIYDGGAHTDTGTASGVLGENLGGLNLGGTTHTNAGIFATDAWTFTDSTGNYNNASGIVSDVISPAPLTVTANDASKIYGTTRVFTGTEFSTKGLITGDTVTSVTLNSSGAAAGAAVGTYAIIPSAAAGTGLANYTIGYVNGTLTVLAAQGSASGHIYNDVTGNGLSSDDTPMSGVTVNLFRDVNGNGVLDTGDGAAVQTTTTNATGAYSFSNLNPANAYFVQEVLPGGYVRTAPALSDNYAATGLANTTGLDFDNFNKTCCTSSVSNVSFLINGKTTVTDLRGNTHQGDTVKVNFTVTSTSAQRLSIVTYNAPDPVFNADDASEQTFYQLATGLFSHGANSMTVTIPANYYQIDFVCGYAIDQLGPAGSNIFYSAQSRLISADNGGLHSDTDNEAATTSFWANLGQSLITSFGGSQNDTTLGNWLATTYPKMYGASCSSSANNLTNDPNTTVAALFKSFYSKNTHNGADAQVMATALNVYASTLSLGGTTAESSQYGFHVTDDGLGAAQFNVGTNGAAFNVANNSTLTVSQLLAAANANSSKDVLYNNVTSLLAMAYNMFSQVNGSGGIAS
ncbi:MAG: MBG domain-containing protein, partial [Tepidisphaeraceae bacterium]